MSFVYHEPASYAFQDRDGHSGKMLATSAQKDHLIIECDEKLMVTLRQNESEFSYYILGGSGYFVVEGAKETVATGDLVVVPAGKAYMFGGKLRMLLIVAPHWSKEQEEKVYES